jgi:hypothetical protein
MSPQPCESTNPMADQEAGKDPLPKGQRPRPDFPRFGLTPYAKRFPAQPRDRALAVALPGAAPVTLADALEGLPRVALQADFHCVTTWSKLGLRWGGVSFASFFTSRIAPLVADLAPIVGAVLRSQDGYRTTMFLEDLLGDDVLLADELDGQPLSVEHGAPLRLVAPRHYGYKSLKHLARLDFCTAVPVVKHGVLAMLDHPRARVAEEERGRFFPGWLLRRVYRPLIARTEEKFRQGLREYEAASGRPSSELK